MAIFSEHFYTPGVPVGRTHFITADNGEFTNSRYSETVYICPQNVAIEDFINELLDLAEDFESVTISIEGDGEDGESSQLLVRRERAATVEECTAAAAQVADRLLRGEQMKIRAAAASVMSNSSLLRALLELDDEVLNQVRASGDLPEHIVLELQG